VSEPGGLAGSAQLTLLPLAPRRSADPGGGRPGSASATDISCSIPAADAVALGLEDDPFDAVIHVCQPIGSMRIRPESQFVDAQNG